MFFRFFFFLILHFPACISILKYFIQYQAITKATRYYFSKNKLYLSCVQFHCCFLSKYNIFVYIYIYFSFLLQQRIQCNPLHLYIYIYIHIHIYIYYIHILYIYIVYILQFISFLIDNFVFSLFTFYAYARTVSRAEAIFFFSFKFS